MAAGRARRVRIKSIRLTAMHGVREEMLERAIMAFLSGTPSSAAAQIAGLDRNAFLGVLVERGVPMTDETAEDMLDNLLRASEDFGNERLRSAVEAVRGRSAEDSRGLRHQA
jgi:hypothetical protein